MSAPMPFATSYAPDPRFQTLGSDFADPVRPAEFPVITPRFWNARAAETVGLGALDANERARHFARFETLPGNQAEPLAMRYHGHQFRVYNPDLGDGRGFLFAQLREADTGRLLDFGTKGSGRTPWSRGGDGRLTLKGGVREVLATAMLEALGVPTSRSFVLYETGETLERGDEPSPTRGAVLTRLSYSHIRFGSFQRHAALERPELIQTLMDHVIEVYYPELGAAENRAAALLTAVAAKSAHLVARWVSAGFVHGVLNTDNMNINGESFDYGPYRFLPRNDPNFVAAYFDSGGLYSFGRQPEAVFWNLRQLAGALSLVSPTEPLVDALNGFAAAYRVNLSIAMLARLGVTPRDDDSDLTLVNAAFRALADGGEACAGSRSSLIGTAARRPRPARWPGSARTSTAARRSSPFAHCWDRTYPLRPSTLHRATSPSWSRKNCCTTRSKPSGPPSPTATTGRPSKPSSRRSRRRGLDGTSRPIKLPNPKHRHPGRQRSAAERRSGA